MTGTGVAGDRVLVGTSAMCVLESGHLVSFPANSQTPGVDQENLKIHFERYV